MDKTFFITGTDTNIGKTFVTSKLLQQANTTNLKTLGLKPIATDSYEKNGLLYNNDALTLQQYSSCSPDYDDVNPYRYKPPVSPHLINQDNHLTSCLIRKHCLTTITKYSPDICYIEGAGGWLCPLSQNETFADIVKQLNIPVILVVGIKLGCLNHAVLTADSIKIHGLQLHGWIANCITPDKAYSSVNIEYLTRHIASPLLQICDYQA